MSELISSGSQVAGTKRRSLRVAAIIAVPLAGLAALAGVSSDVRFLASVAPTFWNSGWQSGSHAAADSAFSSRQSLLPRVQSVAAEGAASQAASHEKSSQVAGAARPDLQPRGQDENSRLLREHFAFLTAGRERFSHTAGYTATLTKRERLGSTLSEEVSLAIKVRHRPFSVYMKWESGDDTGKEVLYVDGQNENQLLVRLGGFKGRILPAFKVDPFGSLVLAQNRYPITSVGMLALADILIERRELEMRNGVVPRVEKKPDADCDGRSCFHYEFEVAVQAQSPVYRKSEQYIDRQWHVPIQVSNYTWPEPGQKLSGAALDEATLIEYYMYSQIDADVRLTDGDFDRANAAYRFHR